MAEGRGHGHRPLARSLEDLCALHQLCRDGRLYDVERWIAEDTPLQVAPEAIRIGKRYAPLDLTLRARRWDPFDLLLEWGADLKTVDVDAVLDTYNVQL